MTTKKHPISYISYPISQYPTPTCHSPFPLPFFLSFKNPKKIQNNDMKRFKKKCHSFLFSFSFSPSEYSIKKKKKEKKKKSDGDHHFIVACISHNFFFFCFLLPTTQPLLPYFLLIQKILRHPFQDQVPPNSRNNS
ncbi:hypothetical protein K457DRAFT_629512 [Linnemannia elongata AG-77]|uniref:Uncharacterized protein n=1 Tax=Linnemannia elongata AG-77 TaxID=1314771 RepID=A0A197JQR9_9FUNG|nr:hypothetical protein K457DRAFT_629512 [Linnemannia elongata AG-77]